MCGASLSPGADVDGLCPACLLTFALAPGADPPSGDASAPLVAAGSTFGPFRIVDLLGKGGMSAVYAAYEEHLDREVALKVLPPELLHDETFGKRLQREARVLAGLEHPHIVPVYGSGIDGGIPWISMRLLAGGTLGDVLGREGRLPDRRAVQILKDVAEALDYAHERGVVHRDIKPTNILLDEDGRASVGDFGLAHVMQGHSARTLGAVVGTPEYMAPEQAQGGKVDHRSDLYSLGVVAYEMLTGRALFPAADPLATLWKHVHDPVPVPSRAEVPRSLFAPVQRALAKRPEDRWPSSTAFVDALERGLTTAPAGRMRRRIVTAAALGVGAVAMAATVRFAQSARPVPPATAARLEVAPLVAVPVVRPPESSPRPESPRAVAVRHEAVPAAALTAPRTLSLPLVQAAAAPGVDDRALEVPLSIDVPPVAPLSGASLAVGDHESVVTAAASPAPTSAPAEASEVVTPPVRISTAHPTYPPVALSASIEGDVLVLAVVGTDGTVTHVDVLRSVHPLLDDAAKRAVARYRYKPALRNGAPISVTVQVLVSFRIQ